MAGLLAEERASFHRLFFSRPSVRSIAARLLSLSAPSSCWHGELDSHRPVSSQDKKKTCNNGAEESSPTHLEGVNGDCECFAARSLSLLALRLVSHRPKKCLPLL